MLDRFIFYKKWVVIVPGKNIRRTEIIIRKKILYDPALDNLGTIGWSQDDFLKYL